MKIGQDCHKDYSHIMGNSQNLSHGNVFITVNGMMLEVPVSYYTRKGMLRKKYKHLVAEAILHMRQKRVAA